MASSFTKKFGLSGKHIQIDKANSLALIAAAITTAVVIFSLVASQALLKRMSYQNKVISLRSKAASQLSKNVKAADTLNSAYQTFDSTPESVIGTKDKNSKIVLDSLPSKYDFPALATSLEGLISGSGNKITSIGGTDNEAQASQDSAEPTPVDIPILIGASGNFTSAQKLILDLERSIRPVKIASLDLTGSDSNLQIAVNAKTYYQPEKKLDIKQVIVTNGKTTAKKTTTTKTTGSAK